MADKIAANKILDYWFAIEFLGQDSYEESTEEKMLTNEWTKFLKSSKTDKAKRKQRKSFSFLAVIDQ